MQKSLGVDSRVRWVIVMGSTISAAWHSTNRPFVSAKLQCVRSRLCRGGRFTLYSRHGGHMATLLWQIFDNILRFEFGVNKESSIFSTEVRRRQPRPIRPNLYERL